MTTINTLARRAIKSWQSWRAGRRYEAHTRRFLKAVPEVASIRAEMARLKHSHRRRGDLSAKLRNALHDRLSAEVWGE